MSPIFGKFMSHVVYRSLIIAAIFFTHTSLAQGKPVTGGVNGPALLVNQVVYESAGPKSAMARTISPLPSRTPFHLVDIDRRQVVYSGVFTASERVADWSEDVWYSRADFSDFQGEGHFIIRYNTGTDSLQSPDFVIRKNGIATIGIPAITRFFFHQRASSPEELGADSALLLFGSNQRVDLRGGWCDASGDVSKYFSHLAYTNFMSPQQTPLVTWSMANTVDRLGPMLKQAAILDSLEAEALYGADYLLRSLSPDGYFYMTVFSYFRKDPSERRIVGLLADSKTTSDYQCAYREGGGMAIAALARISAWKKDGAFRSSAYLSAAERAFEHLQQYNTRYDDDGKENIIDDYCALMAASELWIVTNKAVYKNEARRRAHNLEKRISPQGYFISNDGDRPFWHASDAGLPVVALARYLDVEDLQHERTAALHAIKQSLDYTLAISRSTANPFSYPRQNFLYRGKVRDGFFIPHENESGWWWQGEDARLGSIATAMLTGGRLVYPGNGAFGVKKEIAAFAMDMISWVLGRNPYNICMMYGYGKNNVPYMQSMYGHGSGIGGISNGITGKDGRGDGSGIDFKVHDNGNEWRWSEQWIPHSGWFLNAITAIYSK